MNFHTTPQVAAAARTSLRAVRIWEAKGLFGEVRRNKRGERIFSPAQLERAKIISAATMAGMGLDEIRVAHESTLRLNVTAAVGFMLAATKGDFDL